MRTTREHECIEHLICLGMDDNRAPPGFTVNLDQDGVERRNRIGQGPNHLPNNPHVIGTFDKPNILRNPAGIRPPPVEITALRLRLTSSTWSKVESFMGCQ